MRRRETQFYHSLNVSTVGIFSLGGEGDNRPFLQNMPSVWTGAHNLWVMGSWLGVRSVHWKFDGPHYFIHILYGLIWKIGLQCKSLIMCLYRMVVYK